MRSARRDGRAAAPYPQVASLIEKAHETDLHAHARRARRPDARLEHEARRASRAAGLRRPRRGHGHAADAGRPPHPLARARIGAEELHRRRRDRPARAAGDRADRPAARQDALELARRRRRHDGGGLPDERRGHAAGGLRSLRRQRARDARSSISHFDASGPHSRGVHALWFVDGEYIHLSRRRRRLQAAQPEGRPVLPHRRRAQSVASPEKSGAGGCRARAMATTRRRRARLPAQFDVGFRAHNTNVFPQRPDRAYVGYIDGGARDARHRRQDASASS